MMQNTQNEKHFNINEVKGWNGQYIDEEKSTKFESKSDQSELKNWS